MPVPASPSHEEVDPGPYFRLFNEIGIIAQLSRAMFEARLPKGMLVAHFAILNHLVRVGDGRMPLDLARAFQVPKATITHNLGVLQRHGLVRLAPNPADGRSKLVWITDGGRTFREAAIRDMTPDFARLAAEAPELDPASLTPDLTALREILDRMRDPRA